MAKVMKCLLLRKPTFAPSPSTTRKTGNVSVAHSKFNFTITLLTDHRNVFEQKKMYAIGKLHTIGRKPPYGPPPFRFTDPCLGREPASVIDIPSSGRYLPTKRDFDTNFVSLNRVRRQTKVISTPRYVHIKVRTFEGMLH